MTHTKNQKAAPDAPLPGARSALILLLVVGLFDYIDRYVLASVIPHIRAEFLANNQHHAGFVQTLLDGLGSFLGHDPVNSAISLLSLAFVVSYSVFSVVFGWFKSKRWVVLALGVLIWSLASGASGLAMTFEMLLLTRCLVGIGEAAYGPLAPAVISDLYPESRRGSVMSWFYLAIPVGSALGFVLGGLVADTLGLGWRWAFYVLVPPGVLLAIICLFMKDPRLGQADGLHNAHEHKGGFKDYMIALRTPSYLLGSLGMAAMTFAIGGMAFWMPSYIHEYRGIADLGYVNLMFGLITVVAGLTGTLIGGIVGDRLKARYESSYFLVSGAAMLVALPAWIATLFLPFPLAWVSLFVAMFCLFFNTGPSNTILANVTHPSIRASAFALNIFIIHALGDVISPFVIGAIADVANMNIAFMVVSAMILVGGLLWLWGTRYLAADTARAHQQLG